jgi:hypothetical protein
MTRSLCLLPVLALAFVAGAAAQTPLPATSPFAAGGNATVTGTTRDPLEFTGVSTMGKKTMLIFNDTTTKKKTWVNVGETVDGITVVSYDPKLDQAVVKFNGTQKTLALRTASAPTGGPAPVPAMPTGFNTPTPAAAQPAPPVQPAMPAPETAPAQTPAPAAPATTTPAKPQTPQEQAKAETEARMLVSDLLEIGMAQRKAYEEAQRKAAEGGNPQQPATPAADQSQAAGGAQQPQQPPAQPAPATPGGG